MEIEWEDTGATLRTVMSIHKCPHGFRSRLGYHATFYLTKHGGEENNIGYIIAWRISKPTGVNPNIDPRYYLNDWYHRSSTDYHRDAWSPAACVWAFYGPGSFDGANYDQVADQEKRDELGDGGNELIVIQTIYIKFREDPKDIESAVGKPPPPSQAAVLKFITTVRWPTTRPSIFGALLQTAGQQNTAGVVLAERTRNIFINTRLAQRILGR